MNKANIAFLLVSPVLIFKRRAAEPGFGTHNFTTSFPLASTFGPNTLPVAEYCAPQMSSLPLVCHSLAFHLKIFLYLQHHQISCSSVFPSECKYAFNILPHKNKLLDLSFSTKSIPSSLLSYAGRHLKESSVFTVYTTPYPFSWTHSNPASIHIIPPILLL